MRLIKAEVVAHNDHKGSRCAIYSMDVQPNGNRLATGGGDCCVKLWNIDALLNKPELAKGALLATLSAHTKYVNVVRWSKDGKFLASGSDDENIMIYKFTPGAIISRTYGSSAGAAKDTESWSRCYQLRGHTMDILDLDWLAGPTENGYTLASASVDNKILVWHVLPSTNTNTHTASLVPSYAANNMILSPRKVLNEHNSYVRGLAYDPIGRYLISAGSDNRIIVWDVENDYAVVRVLDEPLRNSPDSGLFRRISWSPDGQSVCVTAATKSTKPVGMVLKRGTWESVADLVGHSNFSISTKFYGHVLQPAQAAKGANGAPKAAPASCAVALGDQSGVVSIWSTQSNRPLYVLREVCNKMITDIAWLTNSAHTVALFCGIDGNLTIADFEGELGRPMPPAALEKHFQTLYGRNINEIQARPQALIESTLALKYAQSGMAPPAELSAVPALNTLSTNGAATHESLSAMRSNGHLTHSQAAPLEADPQDQAKQTLQLQQMQQTQVIGGKRRIRPLTLVNNLDSPDEVTNASLSGPALVPGLVSIQAAPSGLPRVSSVASSGQNSVDFGHSGDFGDDFADPGASLMAKRMRPDGGAVAQNGAMAAFNRNGHAAGNIAGVASSSNGVVNRPITPNGHVLPRGGSNGGMVAMAAPAVERYMTIRFENDEVVCSVPLLGSQQRIQRFVKTPLPLPSTSTAPPVSVRGAGLGSAFVLDPSIYSSNEEPHTKSPAPSLVVTAARLTKPSILAQLKHSGGSLSSVTLSALQDTSAVRGEVERDSEGHWTAIVAGEVTCLAATEAPRTAVHSGFTGTTNAGKASASFLNAPQEGLVLAGCSDGTVHCLGLGCGVRFAAPMVLGAAVSYLDLQHLPNSTSTSTSRVYLALAATADGELWKWEVDVATAKFRCIVRTNLRPVLLSMKCRHGASSFDKQHTTPPSTSTSTSTSSALTTAANKNGKSVRIGTEPSVAAVPKRAAPVSIRVEQCHLSDTGAIQVHLLSLQGGAAEGGDWQAFAYDADAMVWTRLADMRYVLSSLFSVKTIGAGATNAPSFSSDHTSSHPGAPDTSLTSLSTLQSLAATGAKFTAKDINGIASAKQAVKFSLNSGTSADVSVGTVQAITESVSGGDGSGAEVKLAPSAEDWANLVTIGHAEDRLSVALSVGNAADIRSWLTAWVGTCCKNGLTGRLHWLARKLIAQHLATTSTTSSVTTAASNTTNSSLSNWLLHLPNPLEVLQTIVLPVIAQNPKVHSLLADINQTLELLNLG